jgi:hypothetical protein
MTATDARHSGTGTDLPDGDGLCSQARASFKTKSGGKELREAEDQIRVVFARVKRDLLR